MSVHGGRLVRSVGITHKSWCWKSASFSSEVLVSSFLESCTGVGGSSQLVLYEARYSLSQRLREVDYRGRSWLRGPSFQQCFQSLFPSASLILMLLRVSHGGVVGLHDVACSAFPGSSSVAPFLVVPLAPFSMAFADGPLLKNVWRSSFASFCVMFVSGGWKCWRWRWRRCRKHKVLVYCCSVAVVVPGCRWLGDLHAHLRVVKPSQCQVAVLASVAL